MSVCAGPQRRATHQHELGHQRASKCENETQGEDRNSLSSFDSALVNDHVLRNRCLPSHTSNLTDRHRGAAPAQAAAGTRAGPVECVAIDTLGSLLGLNA